MALTDFAYLIGWYDFSAAGFDEANNRFMDKSGLQRHLDIAAGTAAFATRSGFSAWNFPDNSCYTESRAPSPWVSFIIVVHANETSTQRIVWTKGCYSITDYANDDHAALTEAGAWTDHDEISCKVQNTGVTAVHERTADPSAATTFTKNQWNIFTFSFNPEMVRAGVQVNALAPVFDIGTPGNGNLGQFTQHIMRIGYTATSGTPISGTLSIAEMAIIYGDVHADQSPRLATEIVAIKTKYGIA